MAGTGSDGEGKTILLMPHELENSKRLRLAAASVLHALSSGVNFGGLGGAARASFAVGVFVPIGAGVAIERFSVSPVQYSAARTSQLTALEDDADGHDEHGDGDGGDGKRQQRHLVLSLPVGSACSLPAPAGPKSDEKAGVAFSESPPPALRTRNNAASPFSTAS